MSLDQKLEQVAPSAIAAVTQINSHKLVQVGYTKYCSNQLANTALISSVIEVSPSNAIPDNGLLNGDVIQFKLPTLPQICDGVTIEFDVSESGGSNPVRPMPSPFFINYIQFQDANGKTIQRMEADEIHLDLVSYFSQEKFANIGPAAGYQTNYEALPEIPAGKSRKYYLPLVSSWLEACQPFLGGLGEIRCEIRFNTSAKTILSGSGTLRLDNCLLQLDMQQLPEATANRLMNDYRSGVSLFFPTTVKYTNNLNMNAATSYNEKLENLTKNVPYAYMFLRKSETAGEMDNYLPIDNFQLTDPTGVGILDGSVTDAEFNRRFQYPNKFPSDYSRYKHLYHIAPCLNPMDFIQNGTSVGFLPMTGAERLKIQTLATETNNVFTLTPSATAAKGSYVIMWTDPKKEVTGFTQPLAYNASASDIKAALEALPNFRGTVTVSGPLTATATIAFDGGDYRGLDIPISSICVMGSNLLTSADANVSVAITQTARGVAGHWGNQPYQLCFLAKCSSGIHIKNRQITSVVV